MELKMSESKQINIDSFVSKMVLGLVCLVILLLGNWIGYHISPLQALPGILFMFVGVILSLLIIRLKFVKLPLFTISLLVGLVASLPFMPWHSMLMQTINQINFLATTTPVLTFAGLSLKDDSIKSIKKVGWKLIIVSVFVFSGTFFVSAILAHIVLKIQGVI
jgi:uncharacterized membrane protein YjgN (DUF898 family)